MKKEDKNAIIENLKGLLNDYAHFYVTDIEGLNAQQTSDLRRDCFKKEIKLHVVKNTLFIKALEGSEVEQGLIDQHQEQERTYCRPGCFAPEPCKERFERTPVRRFHHPRRPQDAGRTCRVICTTPDAP